MEEWLVPDAVDFVVPQCSAQFYRVKFELMGDLQGSLLWRIQILTEESFPFLLANKQLCLLIYSLPS